MSTLLSYIMLATATVISFIGLLATDKTYIMQYAVMFLISLAGLLKRDEK